MLEKGNSIPAILTATAAAAKRPDIAHREDCQRPRTLPTKGLLGGNLTIPPQRHSQQTHPHHTGGPGRTTTTPPHTTFRLYSPTRRKRASRCYHSGNKQTIYNCTTMGKLESRISKHVEILGFTDQNITDCVSSILDRKDIPAFDTRKVYVAYAHLLCTHFTPSPCCIVVKM